MKSPNKISKSFFYKYFLLCASITTISITIISIIFTIFAGSYFKKQEKDLLELNLKNISDFIKTMSDDIIFINNNDNLNSLILSSMYNYISHYNNYEIFFVNNKKRTIFCTQKEQPRPHKIYSISEEIYNYMDNNNIFSEFGNLNNVYKCSTYTVGKKQISSNGNDVGYIFISKPSTDYYNYINTIFTIFIISAIIIIFISYIIVYMISKKMIDPLRKISQITRSISNGEFTSKLEVYEYRGIRELSMSINNMSKSLLDIEKMRQSFIANVSHELRTPMTSIIGFIDGILDNTIPREKQHYYLNIVSQEVKRLSRLVKSMLNLSRIESGELSLNIEYLDIMELSSRIIFTFEEQIKQKNLDIKGLSINKYFIYADKDLIYQAIYNLIENAIKFSNQNGYIELNFNEENQYTIINIKNSGKGLSKEQIPNIFDRFYKTDKSRGIDKDGVGLGLNIVKTIIKKHDGEIMVKSVENQYTNFLFSLKNKK